MVSRSLNVTKLLLNLGSKWSHKLAGNGRRVFFAAAINRNVTVRLLVSDRANSRPYMKRLLWSLSLLNGMKQVVKIEIRLFSVSVKNCELSRIL